MKIFLDSSDISAIKEFEPRVQGFTTNPSLARKAGITDYEEFCKEVLEIVKGKPVSFEVLADEFDEMERQARIISSWGENIYVKIPITNTKGESSSYLINRLLAEYMRINITAVFLAEQLNFSFPTNSFFKKPIVSIFAGRIADTGLNPVRFIKAVRKKYSDWAYILWASPREVLNIYQAEKAGADIITVTPELFIKYEKMRNYDLNELSLDTVRMFFNDGQAAGYKL